MPEAATAAVPALVTRKLRRSSFMGCLLLCDICMDAGVIVGTGISAARFTAALLRAIGSVDRDNGLHLLEILHARERRVDFIELVAARDHFVEREGMLMLFEELERERIAAGIA